MDQVYSIRYLKRNKGKNYNEIMEETGYSFETVKKYADMKDFNVRPRPKQKRKSKLDPYEDTIREWLEGDLKAPYKQRHTAQRVYDRLKEEFPDFNASDRLVRTLVAKLKEELNLKSKGYIPLEHPAGEAQVDFGSVTFIENGVEYDGNYLNVSFPYSNAGYTQIFKAENQECLLEGLKNIFEHIEGVPTRIWFDNMSTAVKSIKEHGKRELTDGFLRFMMHYGFESNFCNPNSGNEKGSVENKVGYHRRNLFVPIPKFNNIEEYNKKLLKKSDEDMNRKHYRKEELIENLFMQDKEEFFELPEVPYEVYKYEFAKVDNYGKVKHDKKIYSSSPSLVNKQVMLKIGAYDIEILDDKSKLIVRHRRLYGRQTESMIWIPYLELIAKRPTAFRYTGFFKELPVTMRTFIENLDYETKKKALKVFASMTYETNLENAIKAFEEGIKCGARDADGIWQTYLRLNSGNIKEIEIKLPETIPELRRYSPNIKEYDQLITNGGYNQ